jgi:hypothetical protein
LSGHWPNRKLAENERKKHPMSEKDKYIEKIKPLLDKWNAEFDQLEAKIRKCGADPMLDFDEVIIALRQHR